jgi:hypothetical protein
MAKIGKKELNDIKSVLGQVTKGFDDLSKKMKEVDPKTIDNTAKAASKLRKETADFVKDVKDGGGAVDRLGEGAGQLAGMFKAPAKDLRSQAKVAGKYAEHMEGMLLNAKKFGINLGAAGKAMGVMGGAVGGISKALLGWPGLILMGLKMVIDTAVQIDAYVKNLNKNFASVRGPDIMTKDVDKQFKEFNDAVLNIGANIRDGLQPQEVQEFMLSVDQAGKRIGTLNEGLSSYRDAVHVAAKASKDLGISITGSGSMMVEMMNNMRMNIKDVDKAFVELAFDAGKSGLSTDKFWASVQNVTHSLAFYGKFLKEVSNTTKVFAQSQVTGADDALESSQRIMKSFKDMPETNRFGFMAMARRGGADFGKEYAKEAEKIKKDVGDITGKIEIAKAGGAPEENIEKMERERAALQVKQKQMESASKGGFISQAQMLPALTGKAAQITMSALKGMGITQNLDTQDLGESLYALTQSINSISGSQLTEDDVRTLIQLSKAQAQVLKNSFNDLQKIKDLSQDDLKLFDKLSVPLSDGLTQDQYQKAQDEFEKNLDHLSDVFSESYGVTKTQAKAQLLVAAGRDKGSKTSIKTYKAIFKELIKNTDPTKTKDIIKRLDDASDDAQAGSTLVAAGLDDTSGSSAEAQKSYDDTFDKIVDNTLSIEDVKKITDQGIRWKATTALGVQKISVGMTRFLRKYLKEKPNQEQIDALKTLPKDMQRNIKSGGGGLAVTEEMLSAKSGKKGAETRAVDNSDLLAALEEIKSPMQAQVKYDELSKKTDKNMSKTDKKMLAFLKSSANANGKIIPEELSKNSGDQIAALKQQISLDQQSIRKYDEQISALNTLDESASEQADLLSASVMGNKASREAFYQMAKEKAKDGVLSLNDLKGASREIVKRVAMSPEHNTYVPEETGEGVFSHGEQVNFSLEKKQGLQSPEMVTSAGPVVLHPRETILPANMGDFKTKPVIMGANPVTAHSIGTGGKSININVSATEKDLAQKIANEIRSVLYKEQINNQG